MPPLSASILIVDDDPDIQAVLADRLAASEGPQPAVIANARR